MASNILYSFFFLRFFYKKNSSDVSSMEFPRGNSALSNWKSLPENRFWTGNILQYFLGRAIFYVFLFIH